MAEVGQNGERESISSTQDQEPPESEPAGRVSTHSFVCNGNFCLYSGTLRGTGLRAPSDSVEMLNLHSGQWSSKKTHPLHFLPSSISCSCCTVVKDSLYVFGGMESDHRRNADVHELNLKSLEWRKLSENNPENGPIPKDKAGMFSYGDHMLGVLGGYGHVDYELVERKPETYHIDNASYPGMESLATQLRRIIAPICWTNELHLFHTERLEWIVPVTTGAPPTPCACFSLTKVDPYRLVVFGGKQVNQRVNHVHILDLDTWHWSGVNCPSRPDEPWPVGRSFHTACSLLDPAIVPPPHAPSGIDHEWLPCPTPNLIPSEASLNVDPKVLVLSGLDNNADPLDDAWELNVNTLTWNRVHLPEGAKSRRVWHTAAAYYPSPCEARMVVFGGCTESLFKTPAHLLNIISRTTVFCCGTQCLSELCIDFIARDDKLLTQLHKLPHRIQKQIQEHVHMTLWKHLTVARL